MSGCETMNQGAGVDYRQMSMGFQAMGDVFSPKPTYHGAAVKAPPTAPVYTGNPYDIANPQGRGF